MVTCRLSLGAVSRALGTFFYTGAKRPSHWTPGWTSSVLEVKDHSLDHERGILKTKKCTIWHSDCIIWIISKIQTWEFKQNRHILDPLMSLDQSMKEVPTVDGWLVIHSSAVPSILCKQYALHKSFYGSSISRSGRHQYFLFIRNCRNKV